jgi:ribosome recycling factor
MPSKAMSTTTATGSIALIHRCAVPRQELVKVAHRISEEGRVSIRTVRRDGFDHIKRADLSDDQKRRLEKDVQAHTDRMMKEIGEHLAHKEAELLQV